MNKSGAARATRPELLGSSEIVGICAGCKRLRLPCSGTRPCARCIDKSQACLEPSDIQHASTAIALNAEEAAAAQQRKRPWLQSTQSTAQSQAPTSRSVQNNVEKSSSKNSNANKSSLVSVPVAPVVSASLVTKTGPGAHKPPVVALSTPSPWSPDTVPAKLPGPPIVDIFNNFIVAQNAVSESALVFDASQEGILITLAHILTCTRVSERKY